jgi:ABC-type nitrate/sulfonate/bicarbonate transport system permease component
VGSEENREDAWMRQDALQSRHWRLAGLALLAVAWEAIAWGLKGLTRFADTILPTWESIFGTALPGFGLFWTGEGGGRASYGLALLVLGENSLATIGRVLAGTASGIVLGILLGVLMGWSRQVRDLTWPSIQLTRPIPTLALIPLFMLWFGGRELGTWLYITWAVFTMMVVYTVEAIRNVPPVLRDHARALGASPAQVYRTVVLPAVGPSVIGGVRVCLAVSWAIVLAAEYLGAQSGLGRMLILSQMFFDTGRMVVIVLLFVSYAVLLNELVVRVSYRLTRWVPS